MTLNGTKYTYETNAQGDIVGLLDSSNNEVLTYNYCPSTCRSMCLGKLISIGGTLASTVGAENPMRYRGYYYDTETGLYYLQSRYYNPDWGRFISQDEAQYHEGMTGAAANLYAYGDNNCVNMIDPTGHISFWQRMCYVGDGLKHLFLALYNVFGWTFKGQAIYIGGRMIATVAARLVYKIYLLQADAYIEAAEATAQQWYAAIINLAIIATFLVALDLSFIPAYQELTIAWNDFKEVVS
jgi:RHS repeat-associated protein